MRILVSGASRTVGRLLADRPDRLGVLMTPRAGSRVGWWPAGTPWAADNDCFQGLHAPRYLRMLAKLAEAEVKPLWVAAPDVVGDAEATLRLFDVWQPVVASVGLPVALVLQDGIESGWAGCRLWDLWGRVAAVFVGGTDAFKESWAAGELCRQAKARGKWVHVGRVNSYRRLLAVARFGPGVVDTVDGGSASRWPDINIPKLVRWTDRALARAAAAPTPPRPAPSLFGSAG